MASDRPRLAPPRKPTKEEMIARFKGKTGATRRGKPNKITRVLKDALLLGAERVGSNGKGKDGLVGYLEKQARDYPKTYLQVLAKILPLDMHLTALQFQLRMNEAGQSQANAMVGYSISTIRDLNTEELRTAAAALGRMFGQHQGLRRLDAVNDGVIDAETAPTE